MKTTISITLDVDIYAATISKVPQRGLSPLVNDLLKEWLEATENVEEKANTIKELQEQLKVKVAELTKIKHEFDKAKVKDKEEEDEVVFWSGDPK